VTVLDPAETQLIPDSSAGFLAGRLNIEARLRQSAVQGDALVMGHQAVMDVMDFQLEPALRVLKQLRPRLLIADTVGLGKTLEAGILASELVRRGRARRILVVTTKSMMQQFQQEFWNRFTIALTRLDSAGIQRIHREIPSNHNPFNYYDRTIISVDTLKRDSQYRSYLESAWWDLIILDEAHNVSWKGNRTQSNRLATLLAQRSDALILLSATPHNGKKESFASLMRMLDPTILPVGGDYTRQDVEELFIRRFKGDVREQMKQHFPERQIYKLQAGATKEETHAFEVLGKLQLASDATARKQADGTLLFKTILEKALFSSPSACLQTIRERSKRLKAKDDAHPDLAPLEGLERAVSAITAQHFGKFQMLLRLLKGHKLHDDDLVCSAGQTDSAASDEQPWRWDGSNSTDRLVIFTERIETLKFLEEHLPSALSLQKEAVATLHGQMADLDIHKTVQDFGRSHTPLRVLIASDVASEGLNLHYQAHRLIHFDIPWSLMVFQQRNGRVDRYGQTKAPRIGYLYTRPADSGVRGDLRYLEILIEKDTQVSRNIGDPSAFMGLYDEEAEVTRTGKAIEQQEPLASFERPAGAAESAQADENAEEDPFAELFGGGGETEAENSDLPPIASSSHADKPRTRILPSLFANHHEYLRDGLRWVERQYPGTCTDFSNDDAHALVSFQAGKDLRQILQRDVTGDIWPADNTFRLSARTDRIDAAIRDARNSGDTGGGWPSLQYFWPLHPVATWLDYKLLASFGRQRAPILKVPHGVKPGQAIILVQAQYPNKRGQTLLTRWMGILVDAGGKVAPDILSLTETLVQTGLLRNLEGGQHAADLANDGRMPDASLWQQALPEVIQTAKRHLQPIKRKVDEENQTRIQQELAKLAELKEKHQNQLELDLKGGLEQVRQSRRQRRDAEIQDLFQSYQTWVRETLELDDTPQFTVVAALAG
jgi:SNF2 family DNA/RNA helicase